MLLTSLPQASKVSSPPHVIVVVQVINIVELASVPGVGVLHTRHPPACSSVHDPCYLAISRPERQYRVLSALLILTKTTQPTESCNVTADSLVPGAATGTKGHIDIEL